MWRYVKLLAELLRLSWREYPRATVGLVAAKIASAGMVPAMALALREAVDEIIGGRLRAAVVGAAAAATAFATYMYLRAIDRILETMLADRLGALHLRRQVEQQLAGLDGLDHLERTDLLDRITVLRGVGWRLSHSPPMAVTAVCNVVNLGLLLLLLGTISPWLLLLLPFAAGPLWFEQWRQRAVNQAEIDTAEAFRLQRHLFNLATEPAGGKEIRVAGAGPQIAHRQRQAWGDAIHGRFRARIRAAAWKLTGWTLFTMGFGASLALVIYGTAQGNNTVGDLVLAITVAVKLRDSVQDAIFGVNVTMSGQVLVEPFLWLREYVAAARSTSGQPAPPALRGGITLDRVSFTYPGTDRRALDNVSFHLPAGSVVAVVGEYGSGKTTLVKMLSKLYLPDQGRIEVDGVDLRDINTADWRARSSAAFQDFGRFQIRFGDTVGLGDLPHLGDDGRVLDAVRVADAEQLVQSLPNRLDTQLGRKFNGVELSEGQWQKTALARASMRAEPLLFVLDEPTASLDAPRE